MKKVLVFALAAMVAGASFAATAGTDDAGHYGGGWTDGSNGGTGFGTWSFTDNQGTGAAGAFIGDATSGGLPGVGTTAFGLYANPNSSAAAIDVNRNFDGAMNIGDIFSFTLGINWDSGSDGGKGFTLFSGGGFVAAEFNLNNASTDDINYTASSSGLMFDNYGTTAMDILIEYTGLTTINVSANGRDGIESFDQDFTVSGAPTGFGFYASQMQAGDSAQPYFNDLAMANTPIPEPATMTLLGLGALAMVLRRKMRK